MGVNFLLSFGQANLNVSDQLRIFGQRSLEWRRDEFQIRRRKEYSM